MIDWVVFSVVFGIFTLLHALVDFGLPYRQWKGEFWLVANPLHALWDSSRFRTHPKFYTQTANGHVAILRDEKSFWRHLAKDQTAHVILNIISALLVAVFPLAAIIFILWFSYGFPTIYWNK